jgi:hypothetical protein
MEKQREKGVFDDKMYRSLLGYLGGFYETVVYKKHNYEELAGQDWGAVSCAAKRKGIRLYHGAVAAVWVSRYYDENPADSGLVIQSEIGIDDERMLSACTVVDFFLLSKLLKRICRFLKKRGVSFVRPVIEGGRCCVQVFINIYSTDFKKAEMVQPHKYRQGIDYFCFGSELPLDKLKRMLDI